MLTDALADKMKIGCFDWGPFAAHLPFDVTMMCQDVEKIVAEVFVLADAPVDTTDHPFVIAPACFEPILKEDG